MSNQLRIFLFVCAVLCSEFAAGQGQNFPTGGLGVFAGIPSGACNQNQAAINTVTLVFYVCPNGTWTPIANNTFPTANTVTESTNTVTATTVSGNWPAGYQAGASISETGCSVAGYNITATIISGGGGGTTLTFTDPTGSLGAASGCTANLASSSGGTITAVTAGTGLTGGGSTGSVTLNLTLPVASATSAAQINGQILPTTKAIVGTDSGGHIVDATSAALTNSTSGTAGNLSGTPALPNGTSATTQTTGDNTTKLATDAFVQNSVVANGAIPSGNQGGSLVYNYLGNGLLSIFEPQSSCSFTAAQNAAYSDRCLAMHACFTSTVNGITGDVCDARCEMSNPTFTCNSNPFPVSTDAQNAGTMLLPPGQISYTACFNFNPANGGEVWGTADGNGTAGGPTMLYAGGGWSPGSGATWCPGLFSWGQPWPGQWNSNSNGQFGPYSTHGGLFQINCHNQSHIHGLDLLSGQDNTWLGRLSFTNCADALIVAGSRGTQNGTIIDGVFATKSSGLGSIANTPESGGIPWLISSWFIMNSGSAQPGNMVMTVTGGACGSGGNSLCDPFPGEDIFIGADSGLSNSGTCTGTGCLTNPVNGTHGTFFGAQLNGQYTIGAVSDFDSVVSYSCVPSNCQGASHTVSITFVMSAPSDFPVDSGGAACVAAYGSPTNCNSNAIGYMSGFTDTHLNNLQVVITQVSGTSVTGWITCAACTGVTSTGGVAYANTIDVAQYAGTTFTAANQFAVHTNLLAGAGCSAASWPGSPSDCWSGTPQISNGTVIVFGNNVVVNNTAGFRPWHQVTLTNTNAFESVFSEYPIQDYTINGWGFGVRDSHLESTVFCGISIGENGPTANVLLENLWVNSNIGFIQTGYCGGAVSGNQTSSCNNVNSTAGYPGIAPAKTCGGSGNLSCGANTGNNHSCAVHIFNRYGSTGCTVTTGTGVPFACGTAGEPVNVHIKQMDMEATGLPGGLGSNVPGFAVVDDGWGNAISNGAGVPSATSCPHLGFYDLDGVGYPSTDCPPGSLNNGASYYRAAGG